MTTRHLFQRLSLTLMRGNAALMDGGQTRIFQQQKLMVLLKAELVKFRLEDLPIIMKAFLVCG